MSKTTTEGKTEKGLERLTKKELINIILRKDDVERDLRSALDKQKSINAALTKDLDGTEKSFESKVALLTEQQKEQDAVIDTANVKIKRLSVAVFVLGVITLALIIALL